MSTRDLGTHIVELHEQGMLTIAGEGTRVTLPAHEALDLLHWLGQQRHALTKAAQTEVPEGMPDWLKVTPASELPTDERESPVDEP